jgi:L-lactate dehydrogenase complex protein LldF
MKSPRWYGWMTWAASRILSRLARSGWMKRLPGPLSGWTDCRDFPAPAAKRFRDLWNEELRDEACSDPIHRVSSERQA